MNTTSVRTVYIPSETEHAGVYGMFVTIKWECPVCGSPRGEPYKIFSYDGSRRLYVDGWTNPCGHIDKYKSVKEEFLKRS
jgi:hypothetical protein